MQQDDQRIVRGRDLHPSLGEQGRRVAAGEPELGQPLDA